MNYQQVKVNTARPEHPKTRILIIYSGGTIGMVPDKQGVLQPFDFSLILEHLPSLNKLALDLTVISAGDPVDSSNIGPAEWVFMAETIEKHYSEQDGFVILHGTDTMAYSASALSFMLSGLGKPVIFTGAQLPITNSRSDARENLITALEIASARIQDRPLVPEVCIYFGDELLRGNRSKKVESQHFDAFESENYPLLARAGVKIDYNLTAIGVLVEGQLRVLKNFCSDVAILKLFPGIGESTVRSIMQINGLKGLILETFGSGNAPTASWFLKLLSDAIESGLVVVNVSQCPGGMVQQGRYETSRELGKMGVIGGADLTTEAAITKLMLLLGEFGSKKAAELMVKPIAGELTPSAG
jgi:L-asparaginase